MSHPKFGEGPYLPFPHGLGLPDDNFTIEAWTDAKGVITDFRIAKGYARYGRLLP
jgi:hypothetical protein